MIAFAVLTGPLPRLGVIAVAALAAAVLLAREDSSRAWAMLAALVLAPVLLLADIWRSPQLDVIHRHPPVAAVAAALGVVLVAALAVAIARRPRLLGPLTVVALPFRIPISVGGHTYNLLVPLYVVIAAAALAWLVPVLSGRRAAPAPRRGLGFDDGAAGPVAGGAGIHRFEQLLAAFLVLYALQASYSVDFQSALRNTVFFYVPFALLQRQLRELSWDRELLTRCLVATAALAVVFACLGFVEEATKSILLNPKLIATNSNHPYFTVNSVFFDPDIFGRYLALVMILLVAVLLYEPSRRRQLAATAVLAVLWGGLVLTLSRSSLGALLVGMATLAALRWRMRPVLIAAAAVLVLGGAAVAISPKTFGLNQGLNNASSGRANLITGGLRMFGDEWLYGYGSGGFSVEYKHQNPAISSSLSDSHTIPITVAAEQGLLGLIVYLALVLTALRTVFDSSGALPARAAIAAAFLALVMHTMLYADFLEDPVTWTLLGVGSALATQHARERYTAARELRRRRRTPAPA